MEVLSDVHAFSKYDIVNETNCAVTRFHICLKCKQAKRNNSSRSHYSEAASKSDSSEPKQKRFRGESYVAVPCKSKQDLQYDEDGDLILERNYKVVDISEKGAVENSDEHSPNNYVSASFSGTSDLLYDEDGDLILERNHKVEDLRQNNDEQPPKSCVSACLAGASRDSDDNDVTDGYYINIKHSLATGLDAVGEQVWQGALLLCDYIIHHDEEFGGKSVVDLGAGTGLTSIVAAQFGDRVYCTDTGDNILKLAKDNVENAILSHTLYRQPCPVHVRDLDWFKGLTANHKQFAAYSLSDEDVRHIQASHILIAADVIYDNDITDAFFNMVESVMCHPPNKTLYIGLERRLVFTLDVLDVTSPGYNYFRHHLDQLSEKGDDSSVTYQIEPIPTHFPQYFNYSRTKQLEMWKISSSISDR